MRPSRGVVQMEFRISVAKIWQPEVQCVSFVAEGIEPLVKLISSKRDSAELVDAVMFALANITINHPNNGRYDVPNDSMTV